MVQRDTPYQPGRRTYPPLPDHLRKQWEAILPSASQVQYRPCSATLNTGAVYPCVYVLEAQKYIDVWGVWPEDDPCKDHIRVDELASLSESPFRLPTAFANQLYRAGETGKGYSVFTLVFADGGQVPIGGSSNAIDFVALPDGRRMADIVRVVPHAGRDQRPIQAQPAYHWCLFGSGEGRGGSLRFV